MIDGCGAIIGILLMLSFILALFDEGCGCGLFEEETEEVQSKSQPLLKLQELEGKFAAFNLTSYPE